MAKLSRLSLSELCAVRIAYFVWTHRRNLTRSCLTQKNWNELENTVLAEVQNQLPLPDKLKLLVLNLMKPIGQHLFILTSSWFSKMQPEHSDHWFCEDMLYDCLVLTSDGLIDQRKTAEKILKTRMLSSVTAFRLACVAFLEDEVIKLWTLVQKIVLKEITIRKATSKEELEILDKELLRRIANEERFGTIRRTSFWRKEHNSWVTTEPIEVLFWIAYCLSKEKSVDIETVPHFAEHSDWYDFTVESVFFSGNIACFDYFYQNKNKKIIPRINEMAKAIIFCYEDILHAQFVFHYKLLNSPERNDLFQKWPKMMIFRFLQWPLSFTFVDKTEEIWHSVPDNCRVWVFAQLITILYRNTNTNAIWAIKVATSTYLDLLNSFLFCMDHIKRIFVNLWNISSDLHKRDFLDSFVFLTVVNCFEGENRNRFKAEFIKNGGLKEKLRELFLANAETVLQLYVGENIPSSLLNIVEKHIPADFEELRQLLISFRRVRDSDEDSYYSDSDFRNENVRFSRAIGITKSIPEEYFLREDFVNFVKDYLFQWNDINNSFVYNYEKTI